MALTDPVEEACCAGLLTRRGLLTEALGAAGALIAAGGLMTAAFGDPGVAQELLVVVFLRGAWDALNVVMPLDGPDRAIYESERPTLKIPQSQALRLDQGLGLHPAAKPLSELYADKKLAVALATGLPSDTRSHFDAQAYMELGTPGKKTVSSGWLARHLRGRLGRGGLPVVAVGDLLPASLLSCGRAAAVAHPAAFNLAANRAFQGEQRAALRRMYKGAGWLSRYGLEALDAIDELEGSPGNYAPANGADYGDGEIGRKLSTLAQLAKMPIGLKAAALDMGGWDTHRYQGASDGRMAKLLGQLSQALAAFLLDLQGRGGETDLSRRATVLVMSEFGRRVKENANHGTDHGHGNLMLVLSGGAGINGGRLYGRWPGLAVEELYQRADLAVSTDFRRVIWEILSRRRGETRLAEVFPGYAGYEPLGLAN